MDELFYRDEEVQALKWEVEKLKKMVQERDQLIVRIGELVDRHFGRGEDKVNIAKMQQSVPVEGRDNFGGIMGLEGLAAHIFGQ